MTSGNKSVIGGGTRFERHDPELVAKTIEAKRRIAAGEEVRVEEPWPDCRRCADEEMQALRREGKEVSFMDLRFHHMFLCPECGNKRCPKATDHRLECTNSNEPGQKGSFYE